MSSGRRWGIGLVTVLVAASTAFVSFCMTLFIAIGLCDAPRSHPGSAAHDFCASDGANVFYVAYLAVPFLAVVVGGIVGIRSQRWSRLWWGLALAVVVTIACPVVIGNLPTGS